MSRDDKQQQTTPNIQKKSNHIWAIADKLVGVYKPHEYGNVIFPMCGLSIDFVSLNRRNFSSMMPRS